MRISLRKKNESDPANKQAAQNVVEDNHLSLPAAPTKSAAQPSVVEIVEPDWRTIYVFPPNKKVADDLKKMAESASMSVSDFVLARVQKSFSVDEVESSKKELQQRLEEKERELHEKEDELQILKSDYEKMKEKCQDLEHEIEVFQSEEL